MVKVSYEPAPINWSKNFVPDFYLIYDPTKKSNYFSWGFTHHQFLTWCFCYDPSNDAETPDLWEDDEENDEDEED